jgi:hypothetical protein
MFVIAAAQVAESSHQQDIVSGVRPAFIDEKPFYRQENACQ